jgi:hypothetical protein
VLRKLDLPDNPFIVGKDHELVEVVKALTNGDPARIAILGGSSEVSRRDMNIFIGGVSQLIQVGSVGELQSIYLEAFFADSLHLSGWCWRSRWRSRWKCVCWKPESVIFCYFIMSC